MSDWGWNMSWSDRTSLRCLAKRLDSGVFFEKKKKKSGEATCCADTASFVRRYVTATPWKLDIRVVLHHTWHCSKLNKAEINGLISIMFVDCFHEFGAIQTDIIFWTCNKLLVLFSSITYCNSIMKRRRLGYGLLWIMTFLLLPFGKTEN